MSERATTGHPTALLLISAARAWVTNGLWFAGYRPAIETTLLQPPMEANALTVRSVR